MATDRRFGKAGRFAWGLLLVLPGALGARGDDEPARPLTIVALGDSITKGVRAGVARGETFAALLEAGLDRKGWNVRVVNEGIGGERTDQALARLEASVLRHKPDIVLVMYGTNDSYVDIGKQASRLTVEQYRRNLSELVSRLRRSGAKAVLMTPPRWAASAGKNGLGENPNVRLEPYVEACRDVARELDVPLVDHYARWSSARNERVDLREWTTDGCHPNPKGHWMMAELIQPALEKLLPAPSAEPLTFRVQVETVLEHDDGTFLWFHPRAAALPGFGREGKPAVLMTLQKHLHTSDFYSGLSVMRSDDLGATWSGPEARPELDWRRESDAVTIAVADVTPGWHAPTRKALAIGAQVRYSTKGQQLDDAPKSNQTAFAIYDPETRAWTSWKRLEVPDEPDFNFARSACAQWLVQPDGTLLLPFYHGPNAKERFRVSVLAYAFDGKTPRYLRRGNTMSLDVDRGLFEPSIIEFQGRYYLTIRNDRRAYVAVGDDGLNYETPRPWTFDDGSDLGSDNTQQHWLAHSDGLFLVYTRRGANNDHVIRHRAPLFIARVDPSRLCVIRKSEQILIPERGATLGNFGASAITADESWVTVAEGVWNDDARKRGAKGAVFVARVVWSRPNRLANGADH